MAGSSQSDNGMEPSTDHELHLHDSARRAWRIELRRDRVRGRTVVVSPSHGDLEPFRASADGYRPDTHLPVTGDEWDLLARAAEAGDDASREAEALRAAAFRLLDRMVRDAQHRLLLGEAGDED